MRYLTALILSAALAGCATTLPDLGTLQRRAVAAIQTAQKGSTQALDAHTITLQQDRDAQARLARGRAAVLAAKTPAEVDAAAKEAGVTP